MQKKKKKKLNLIKYIYLAYSTKSYPSLSKHDVICYKSSLSL